MENNKWHTPLKGYKTSKCLSLGFLLSFIFMFTFCNGQDKKIKDNLADKSANNELILDDTLNKPKVNIKVNKQYDKNGNLIRFDSTYSYVYKSNTDNFSLSNDSTFNKLKSYFNIPAPGMFEHNNGMFMNDSLFTNNFFNEDYFRKQFELDQTLFADFYKQMDVLKKNYLRDSYPDKKENKAKKL